MMGLPNTSSRPRRFSLPSPVYLVDGTVSRARADDFSKGVKCYSGIQGSFPHIYFPSPEQCALSYKLNTFDFLTNLETPGHRLSEPGRSMIVDRLVRYLLGSTGAVNFAIGLPVDISLVSERPVVDSSVPVYPSPFLIGLYLSGHINRFFVGPSLYELPPPRELKINFSRDFSRVNHTVRLCVDSYFDDSSPPLVPQKTRDTLPLSE